MSIQLLRDGQDHIRTAHLENEKETYDISFQIISIGVTCLHHAHQCT